MIVGRRRLQVCHQLKVIKQCSEKMGQLNLEAGDWRLEAVPLTLTPSPSFIVLASRNFSSQEVNEIMRYGGGEGEVEEGENGVRRKED